MTCIRIILILCAVMLLISTQTTAANARSRAKPNLHRLPIPAGDKKPVDFSDKKSSETLQDPMLSDDAIEVIELPKSLPTAPQGVVTPEARKAKSTAKDAGTVMLNFNNAGLGSILKTVGNITGKNFILAPGVNAKISIQTTKPIFRAEVFGIFETILDLNGLAAVKTGSYYMIVMSSVAKQRPIDVIGDRKSIPSGDSMINLIVPVKFITSNELIQVLKPMASPAGNMVNYLKTNTLIITDTASNMRKFTKLIDILDVDLFSKMIIELIPIANVDVKTFAKELSDVLGAFGYGTNSTQLSVVPIERLNSVMLMSQSPKIMDSAKQWISKLDSSTSSEGNQINIYYVQNDKASNLKTFLEQIFEDTKGPSASAFNAKARVTPGVTVSTLSAQSERAATGSKKLNIYLYEPTNALIIYSSRRDYQNILSTLKELDRPPKQVLIDALIAEIKLDETTKYGIQWSVLNGHANIQQNTGVVSSTLSNAANAISPPFGVAAPTGLSVLATDASKFFGVLQALATKGKVNVLSNPHILVKNYEKATINIGSDEPVATQSTQSAVTGTASLIQSIEYRKTGIILTVSPQIAEGGMVAMNVRQEVSDKSTDRTVGNAVYPSFSQREAETTVVAKNNEMLVIGGLMQEKHDRSNSGIPLLKDIPFFGNLFKFSSIVDSKTELLILITPRVISNSEEASDMSNEMQDKLGDLRDLLGQRKTGVVVE